MTRDQVNDYLRDMALHSELQRQIDYVNSPEVVSTDFVGSRHAGIVDAQATIANGNASGPIRVVRQRGRLQCPGGPRVNQMAGVTYPIFPKRARQEAAR